MAFQHALINNLLHACISCVSLFVAMTTGPNFDYTYYITVTGVIGSIVNFLGVILYQNFLSGWRFRPALILTLIVGSLASIIDLIIIKRWNIAIGIPDKIFFLFGNAIFENLVIILQSIPMSSIYAKIAPPGMESAVFGKFCFILQKIGPSLFSHTGTFLHQRTLSESPIFAIWLVICLDQE